MLHAFLTFFSQPTGDMLLQLFWIAAFGLTVFGYLYTIGEAVVTASNDVKTFVYSENKLEKISMAFMKALTIAMALGVLYVVINILSNKEIIEKLLIIVAVI